MKLCRVLCNAGGITASPPSGRPPRCKDGLLWCPRVWVLASNWCFPLRLTDYNFVRFSRPSVPFALHAVLISHQYRLWISSIYSCAFSPPPTQGPHHSVIKKPTIRQGYSVLSEKVLYCTLVRYISRSIKVLDGPPACFMVFYTLKMEAEGSFETPIPVFKTSEH